jgi:hypothetical protein
MKAWRKKGKADVYRENVEDGIAHASLLSKLL